MPTCVFGVGDGKGAGDALRGQVLPADVLRNSSMVTMT